MNPQKLMVMAGPNGSGKSTVTAKFQIIGYYINADDIQRELGCTPLEAAQNATATREYMLSNNRDFTFESVLSTMRNYELMQRAKAKGYKIICIYILTKNPEINVRRVKARVERGGHNVPTEKIRERYLRAMKLFPKLFELCDELYVYDNSYEREESEPEMFILMQYGEIKLMPTSMWPIEDIDKLCSGNFTGEPET